MRPRQSGSGQVFPVKGLREAGEGTGFTGGTEDIPDVTGAPPVSGQVQEVTD